jgi:hypothetical protein
MARIGSLNIKRDGLVLKGVEASGVEFNCREMASGELNIRPIVRKLTNPNKQSTFRLYIDDGHVTDGCFRYERLVHRNPEYGVDYFDMEIHSIDCELSDFKVVSGVVSSKVKSLYAKEKSGFVLNNMTGNFVVDNVRTYFDDNQVNVYSIDGKLLLNNVHLEDAKMNLQRGIYIINGSKILIE